MVLLFSKNPVRIVYLMSCQFLGSQNAIQLRVSFYKRAHPLKKINRKKGDTFEISHYNARIYIQTNVIVCLARIEIPDEVINKTNESHFFNEKYVRAITQMKNFLHHFVYIR